MLFRSTSGALTVISYSGDGASGVQQEEVDLAVAASHTHTNAAELDLVADGDHDVSDGTSHANVATNDSHVAGAGADHADVATNSVHVAVTGPANPHGVTDLLTPFAVALPGLTADWVTAPPATVQDALNRLASFLASTAAAPIP